MLFRPSGPVERFWDSPSEEAVVTTETGSEVVTPLAPP